MGRSRTIADSRWLIVGAKTFSPPRTVGAGHARDGQWAPSWAGPPSQPGRWSVLAAFPRWRVGTIKVLDGCLAPAQGRSFCGSFAIVSRAWPAPTETSIVVGRSGPRPRCQGGHARWWPPLTQDGAGAQGAAFCPRFVTITGTTFSWVPGRINPKQPFVSTSIFISSNPRRSARRIECPP